MGGNYSCQVCNAELPASRARVHCRICSNYDSCADCHVTESVTGTHCAEHDYEVHIHDRIAVVKGSSGLASKAPDDTTAEATSRTLEDAHATSQTALGTSSTAPEHEASSYSEVLASETYWGQLLTPMKTPSPIFSRLTTAIFQHFDAESAGELQPGEFCALMFACGFSPQDFPPLQVSTNESASPDDLHELDAWLANWYRSFPLDHRMATREFPPPPPVEPVDGRIRMRDQFLHVLKYPQAPVVPNGLPVLSRLGLEQYFMYLLLNDPANFFTRLNQLLGALPRLTDPETSRLFEAQLIPRACFPLIPDPEEQEKERIVERQQYEAHKRMLEDKMQAEHDALMAISMGMRNAGGGWFIDDGDLSGSDVVDADPNLKSSILAGKRLRLTDANRGGILLREKILTLRSHSSITNVLAEAVDESTFKLRVTAYGGNNYVRNDGNVFIADTDSAHAAVFDAKRTELGADLYYNNQRPALFDRHFDIGIGPWAPTCTRSQTPILIWWGPLAFTWRPQQAPMPFSQDVIPGEGARSYPYYRL